MPDTIDALHEHTTVLILETIVAHKRVPNDTSRILLLVRYGAFKFGSTTRAHVESAEA